MKIKMVKIEQGFFSRSFEFSNYINLIYSTKNSVGKTTLLRLILWGLGYDIPATKRFDFNKTNVELTIDLDDFSIIKVLRIKPTLTVTYADEEITYLLPGEAEKFHSKLYGSANKDILANMLGALYLDQEKGWTLLNRGSVIGKNYFNVESLIRGLSSVDCEDLIDERKKLVTELFKYQKMLDISKYQQQINEESGNLVYEQKNEEIQTKIATYRYQQRQIEDELQRISAIIKENDSFKNYIEKMKLTVVSPKTGEEIPVNKNTIKGFEDVQQIALARKRIQLMQLQKVTNKIMKLTNSLEDTNTLVNVESLIDSFDSSILNIPINAIAVDNVINQLKKRKKELEELIETRTMSNNMIINDIYKMAYHYLKELGVDKYANNNEDYLFTSDLKALSGAILHLTVFSFRLAYIKSIEKQLNIYLPIIIDSPSGKEVQKENVEKMMDLLERDFSNNQVIIASIYQYDIKNLNIITIEKSLMGEDF